MVFVFLLAITGLTLSAVAIYYSVIGLTAIFAAAFWPIVIMGTSLEVSKLVAASWLKANWERIPRAMKAYMMIAVVILMLITSMGIFGFLSKAHTDQNLVSGDVQSKIAIYDEKIKTAKENIEANRRQLKQMDEAVDQVMARSTSEEGATKANNIRRSQQRDRSALAKEIEANQKLIAALNDEASPIRAEVRKVEAEVGPIKYIAKFVYGDNPDENILEKAVTWVIMIIIFVFDPMAVLLLLASQMTYAWYKEQEQPAEIIEFVEEKETEVVPEELLKEAAEEFTEDDYDNMNVLVDPNPHPVGWMYPKHANIQEYRVEDADEELVEEQHSDDIEIANAVPSEKEAMTIWKRENPDSSLKEQRRLLEHGAIAELPWQKYLKAQPDNITDNEAAEEAAKWAAEQLERPGDYLTEPESKKKDLELDGESRKRSSDQNPGEVGYIQNAEQGKSTLWSRIHKQ